jgi:hypothetical protein
LDTKVPLFLNGTTLKDVVKEDDEAPDDNYDQANADDPIVDSSGRDSQQKDANAHFDKHHVDHVSDRRQCLPL